ncbi:MAG: cytochrome c [Burkholderiales bacterium]
MKALFLALFPALALAQGANVQMCAGCHGAQGDGNAKVGAPAIAGQPKAYLERQLAAYADGRREQQVMSPIAKGLAPEQRSALAEHYAALKPAARKTQRSAAAGSSNANRAHALATRGDEAKELQACQNCHGPGGTGFGDINPYLAGLDARYLEASLAEWRSGTRKTDASGQMTRIAKRLSDADVRALAAYYAQQPMPQPRRAIEPRRASQGERTQPGAGGEPRKGSGVTGEDPSGSQGPGGAGTK